MKYQFSELFKLLIYLCKYFQLAEVSNLLKLNRDQLRWVVGLLTGHCHLKGHLFKLGLKMIQLVKGASKKTNQPHISYVIVRP
jgi:hypothetical protein